MVRRPKSMATVVAVLAPTRLTSSMPEDQVGHRRLGDEGLDLGDGADEGRLAHPEAARDHHLDGDRIAHQPTLNPTSRRSTRRPGAAGRGEPGNVHDEQTLGVEVGHRHSCHADRAPGARRQPRRSASAGGRPRIRACSNRKRARADTPAAVVVISVSQLVMNTGRPCAPAVPAKACYGNDPRVVAGSSRAPVTGPDAIPCVRQLREQRIPTPLPMLPTVTGRHVALPPVRAGG